MKATLPRKKLPTKAAVKENSFPVVAIGASAGGLEAMMELLKYLPADTGMAFIYVQHLSPDHKSMLTEILSKKTSMIVQEIDNMDAIKPNNVFVIPHNKGIEVTDGHIKLIPRSETSAAISIDILFSSLADAQKERVIGIVLSGSASDGTVGMKAIKHQGGLTFAQDDTAKFTSMPHSAIAAGIVDFILSPKEIALELARLSKHPLIKTIGVKNGEEDLIDNHNPDLKIILNQLHKATGVDFSAYKMSTIKRRIIRRMLLYKITNLKEYAKLLTQKKEEIDILYQDLLINVTSFFRDTDTHKYLKETLFPKLLQRKKTGETLRIWVSACATGEEAYSLAMMLLEIQGSQTTNIPVQIFATDLSQQAIANARVGVYTKQELETVSPKRIQRFFTKDNGSFRVNKAVRDLCVFAPHNILRDPPFSRLDFISCCNLFIYLDIAAQKKVVNTFHYALNNDGFLMLGKSENISQSANLFTSANKKYKIFSRKINSNAKRLPELAPRFAQQTVTEQNIPLAKRNKTQQNITVNHHELDNAIDTVLVTEFMPASVVINHQMEIVQFRGTTDLFLTHPKGKATFNILKMARPEIAFELRNAISKVIKTKHRIRKSGIELKINATVKIISVEIVPLKIEWDDPLLLILFTEQEQTEIYSLNLANMRDKGAISLAKDRKIKKLEQELAAAHADALAISQEQEAFTEELQSANEEVVSSNEELQTVNEELETSKEEIESANEELTTTNQELQTRNDLLNESYEYSAAIISTMYEPLLVLGKDLRVKSANKAYYKQFATSEVNTEGMLVYELGNKQWDIPKLRELLETIIPKNSHFHDFEVEHTFETIGKKIVLLNASPIIQKMHREHLILLSIVDITEVRKLVLEKSVKEKETLELQIEAQKKIEEAYKIANAKVRNLFLEAPAIICVHRGPEHVFELSSKIHQQVIGNRDIIGKPVRKAMPDLEGSGIYELLDHVYSTGEPFVGNEYLVNIDRGNGKLEDAYFNFVYQPTHNTEGKIDGLLVHGVEVTEQVLARKKIEENKNQLQNIFLNAPAAISIFEGPDLKYVLANKAYEKLSNRNAADLLGKNMQDLFPELKGTGTLELFRKVLETGESFSTPEYAIMVDLKKEGVPQQCYFNFSLEPLRNDLGEIYAVMAMTYDITEQVKSKKVIEENEKALRVSQEALKRNERQLQNVFQATTVAIGVLEGPEHKYNFVNPVTCQLLHRTKEELLGKTVKEVFPEVEAQGTIQLYDEVYNTGKPFTINELPVKLNIFNDNIVRQRYFDLSCNALRNNEDKIYAILITAVDVTEQVDARKKIEDSEKRYNMMLMQSPFAFAVLKGKDMVVTIANDSVKQIWGKGDKIEGKPLIKVLPELKDQEFPAILDKVYTTGIPYMANESLARVKRKGKLEDVYFNFAYQPYRETDNTILGITIMAIEVTEQVKSRKRIEENDTKQSFLLKLSDAIKELIDPVDIQLTACRILGEHVKASRVVYGEVINEKQITLHHNYVNGVSPIIGTLDAEQFGQRSIDAFKHNEKVIISDINTDDRYNEDEKQSFLSIDVVANAGMGLIKGGRWVATFGMHNNTPRKWTETEIWLLEETAERTWSAVERSKAEQALQQSEEKYRSLFTSIDQGYALCELVRNKKGKGIDYYVLEVNPTYEKQSGVSIEMVRGKTILQTFPSVDNTHIDAFAAVVDNKQSVVFENYFDYNNRWFELNVHPAEKDKFVVLFSDITERKIAEEKIKESENRFRTMADASPILIWTLDASGSSSYYNKTFLDFIGVSEDEVISDWEEIVHPDDVKYTLDTINTAIAERHSYSIECRLLRADGQWRWVLAQGNSRVGLNNVFLGFVGSSIDITERKIAEEKIEESEKQLRELSNLLEEKVLQRTTQLKEKNTELRNMNKELEAFTYVSSHDLHEPLRKIQLFAGRILEKEHQNLSEKGKDYFYLMQDSAKRMQQLINDLLAFSRINATERKFENTDLNIIIEEVKEELKEIIAEKHAIIETAEQCEVKIIPFQFRQLLHNLIGNALKFSKPDIAPRIIIKSELITSYPLLGGRDACHITITDNGIGFENEFTKKIFEIFQRLHGREEYSGTGIGLAIVKKIVDNHNGIITATSELGNGAQFDIYLPANQTPL